MIPGKGKAIPKYNLAGIFFSATKPLLYNPMALWESKNPFSNCNFNGSGLPHARTFRSIFIPSSCIEDVALLYLADPHFSIPTCPAARSHDPSSPVKSQPSSLRFLPSAFSFKPTRPVYSWAPFMMGSSSFGVAWEAARLGDAFPSLEGKRIRF